MEKVLGYFSTVKGEKVEESLGHHGLIMEEAHLLPKKDIKKVKKEVQESGYKGVQMWKLVAVRLDEV